jgi:predicted nicotinamide N-methyase
MNTMAPIRMEEQNNTQATGILTALKLKAPTLKPKLRWRRVDAERLLVSILSISLADLNNKSLETLF